MPNYSTTKLTPSSTTKFPANNGNTPGYVEGSDLTTKAEFNDAINAIKGRNLVNISASSFDEFLLKLATALHNEYNPLDTFMCWLDWSGNYTFLVQGLVQNSTSVFFTVCTYSNFPSYCVLVLNGVVYMKAL